MIQGGKGSRCSLHPCRNLYKGAGTFVFGILFLFLFLFLFMLPFFRHVLTTPALRSTPSSTQLLPRNTHYGAFMHLVRTTQGQVKGDVLLA